MVVCRFGGCFAADVLGAVKYLSRWVVVIRAWCMCSESCGTEFVGGVFVEFGEKRFVLRRMTCGCFCVVWRVCLAWVGWPVVRV